MTRTKNKVLVIEANGIAWASYCTMQLSTREGEGTGAIFGCLKSIRSHVNRFAPDRVFVCFDKGRNQRRIKMYPEYKSDRGKCKTEEEKKEFEAYRDECRRQIDLIPQFLLCLGIPTLQVKGLESDDVVAVLAKVWSQDSDVTIVSNDKDFLQLVDENISVYNHVKDTLVTDSTFEAATQKIMKVDTPIKQESWNIFRALVGDSSDNIPGVYGCGVKKSVKFVEGCSTIEELVEKMKTTKGAVAKRIVESEKDMRLYQDLMDLRSALERKADLALILNELKRITVCMNRKKFYELCKKYEFDSIYTDLVGWLSPFKVLT